MGVFALFGVLLATANDSATASEQDGSVITSVVNEAGLLARYDFDEDIRQPSVGPPLAGLVTTGTGVVGQAGSFDSTTQLTTAALPSVADALTLEMWIDPADLSGGLVQTLASRNTGPGTSRAGDLSHSYTLMLYPSNELVFQTDETTTRVPSEIRATVPGVFTCGFHHVAATWDQSTMAIYFDGVQVAHGPSQGGNLNPATSTPFRIGGETNTGFNFFGKIDDVAVWNRSLSAPEIFSVYSANAQPVCAPELAVVTNSLGMTEPELNAIILSQGQISAAIEPLKDAAWFVDMAFEPDYVGATVLVEPGMTADADGAIDLPDIAIEEAALNAVERASVTEVVSQEALALLGSAYLGATYDAFENAVLVAADLAVGEVQTSSTPSADLEESASQLESLVAPSSTQVRIVTEIASPARGGMKAYFEPYGPSNYCTTSFGMWNDSFGTAYLTAGHCGFNLPSLKWKVEDEFYRIWPSYADSKELKVGGYQDRMFIRAANATWLTQIQRGTLVDMAATAGHPYLNQVLCRYGQSSDNLNCGSVTDINIPAVGPVVWTSKLSGTRCTIGDSGGPVWSFRFGGPPFWGGGGFTRHPEGLISAINLGAGECLIVALDDQLVPGWRLL